MKTRPFVVPGLLVLAALLVALAFAPAFRVQRSETPPPPSAKQSPGATPPPRTTKTVEPAKSEREGQASAPAEELRVPVSDSGGRVYVVAMDEVQERLPDGKFRTLRLAPAATPATLGSRIAGLATENEVLPVCYEEGKPHTPAYQRLVTRDFTVRLADQSEPQLPAGIVLKERPSYAPGYAIVSAADPLAAIAALATLREAPGVAEADIQLAVQRQKRAMPNDPLVANQWHLKFQNQPGAVTGTDLNIENAWLYGGTGGVRGAGIRIGIVDDGLQVDHPDLAPNVDTVNDKDWNGNDADPSPGSGDDHGTACAGNAAARGNNGVGVSGTAPEATLVGMRLIAAATTDSQEAEALAYLPDLIPIKSNSWGPSDDGRTLEAPGPLARAALANATSTGRGGLGTLFLWAGGNGGDVGDNSNYDGYANDIHTIAIAALDSQRRQADYSEPGANLVVTAPSDGAAPALGITTVDRTGSAGYNSAGSASGGDYCDDFGGTSSATPTAAGVVALILQKNPALGWRDVQEILIRSATKINPTESEWVTNAAGFHFNHKYGAGLLNATDAVNLAAGWTNLAAATSQTSSQSGLSIAIPDNNATGVTRTFAMGPANLRCEQIELTLTASHAYRGDLEVTLTSPSGTVSRLAEKHSDDGNNYSGWTFTSVRCWGENSAGTWTLKVADRTAGTTGTLSAAALTIHGTTGTPVNPGPIVGIGSPSSGAVFSPGASVPVTVSATDANADGSAGTVASVQLLDNGASLGTDMVAPFSFTLTPALGAHSLTAIATDGEGKTSTSAAVAFSVVDQPPSIATASLTPAGQFYADQDLSVTGLSASDPEGHALSFTYAWERSSDAAAWISVGVTTATLPADPARSGFLWRCRVTASDGTNSSAAFVTAAANGLTRPPGAVATGAAFSYTSGLVLRGTESLVSRQAIVNEFSQGSAGVAEWVEILTLQAGSLRNWKLADASGNQLAFADLPVWDSVPAGTLIVVYSGTSRDALLPADDGDPAGGSMVIASNNAAFFTGAWPGYGNGGDAVILRNPAGTAVAGLSYGSSSTISPVLGGITSGNAAYYSGNTDVGASLSSGWKITNSTTARSAKVTRAAGDLFLSEYVEGSSNNKAIELYNPSPLPVSLAGDAYKLEIYANGSTSAAATINLTGTVPAGGTFVLKYSLASAIATFDQTSGSLTFNGDDALVLKKGTTIVDSFGQVGFDPGTAWTANGVTTVDRTLRCKSSVIAGDTNATDAFDPSVEWDSFPVDTFDGLGSYNGLQLAISPASIVENAGSSAATGTVTLPAPPAMPVTVTLASSDPTAATVPASVIIPAGQTSVTFPVAAVDDSESDGSQTAVISATASGYPSGVFNLTVTDNEPSLEGVTPGAGNNAGNAAFVADLRSGALNAPALFRIGSGSSVPAGLTLTPATGVLAGTITAAPGSYPIVIERFNTLGEVVSQSFTLQVTAAGGYVSWIAGYPVSDASAAADPDRDGFANVLEYYLAGDPNGASTSIAPVLEVGPGGVTLTFWHLKSATDVTGVVEWSENLAVDSWSASGVTTQVIADEANRERIRATLPAAPGSPRRFVRLRVE